MAKKKYAGHVSQDRVLQTTSVYLMTNFPLFFINKFGISDKPDLRKKQVDKTTIGSVHLLFSIKLPFGYELEQLVHFLYAWCNFTLLAGSGRTEWFIGVNPIVGGMVMHMCNCFGIALPLEYTVLSFFCPFIWLDGVFWLVVFWLGKIVFVFAVVLILLYTLAHIE